MHCHKEPSHHERDGAFGDHDWCRHNRTSPKINRLVPDYMVMGERGMADMAEMEMPLPDNTFR